MLISIVRDSPNIVKILVFEEIIEQDPTKVNEELIPLMNSPRTTHLGKINPYEIQGQKIYITTAGSTLVVGALTYFSV